MGAALLLPADTVVPPDLLRGALSGVGSATAMRFLNRGLSHGAMSVVVPVSAVTGVPLSVLCGVLVLGDRPGALAPGGHRRHGTPLWWVVLGLTVLRERIARRQAVGPVGAAVATVLLTVG
ncbi:hypothetical protein GCM10010294_15710 [Streptomyces griseoloalbus]|uniref:hypothetical protein n=1 Tax=Streptomyces griseoloalbus TaxID=67303 RepID=UPI0018749D08|nr:hypothetical protein GCM10010294_15710 [Streptomyces griseoloalbus]